MRDTAGSTAVEAIEDLLGMRFKTGEAVYTSKIYVISGQLPRKAVEHIAKDLLANEIIHQWKIFSKEDLGSRERELGFQSPRSSSITDPE